MKRLWRWRYLGGITLGVASAVIGLQLTGGLQFLERAILDQWFRSRAPEPRNLPIVLVLVNEKDIEKLGRWPMSDAQLAQLLRSLKEKRPAVIGINLYRDLPVDQGWLDLQEVFQTTPNLIGVKKAVGNASGPAVPPPAALEARDQIALSDIILDADGVVRRNLLSIHENGKTTLSLGTKAALLYLSQRQIRLETGGKDGTESRLGKAQFQPLKPNDGGYVRVDLGGYQTLSNFLRVPGGFPTVSLTQVISNQVPADQFKDKIVLIGSKAESLWGERFFTPYTTNTHTTWAGVELQANITAQIISGALENRPFLQGVPEIWEWVWVLFWSGLGTVLGWSLRSFHWAMILIPSTGLSLIFSAYGLFLLGWWVVAASPFLALIAAALLSRGYWVWRRLQQTNQLLELKVQERTQELLEKNADLEQARLEADAANRAKSVFLANMSHELRTPLTSILGFAQMMERDPSLSLEHREHTRIINRSGTHLLKLINEILDLSKIEAGRMELEESVCDFKDLLQSLRDLFRYRAEAKALQFNLELDPELPVYGIADSGKLQQVLINLLANALKFTQQGSITLRVFRQPASEPTQDQIQFEVVDTGSGISLADQEAIFEAFTQAQAGKTSSEGTGLGLTISRRFVQLMGGELQVSSIPGEGSNFWFAIPLKRVSDPDTQQPVQTIGQVLGLNSESSVGLYCVWTEPAQTGSIQSTRIETPSLQPEDLQSMPIGWVEQLRDAAMSCDDARLYEIIAQTPVGHEELMAGLKNLCRNYQFDIVVQLAEEAIEKSQITN